MRTPYNPPIPIGAAVEIIGTHEVGYVRGWLSMRQKLYIDRDGWPWNVSHFYAPDAVRPVRQHYSPATATEPAEEGEYDNDNYIPF